MNDQSRVRVLIAEDSLTTMELLGQMLESDPRLCVVGRARNGERAVSLSKALHPDVVVMDVHMPVLDGFEATRQIMIESPTPIVIVSSAVDVRAVEVSLHALRLGALTVMAKPAGPGAHDFAESRDRFISTVRAMAGVKVVRRWAPVASAALFAPRTPVEALPEQRPPGQIIAIAASTGGPAALLRVLSALPATLPASVLIVQHLAPGFVAGLASWLSAGTGLTVKVAESGERLVNGVAYLAPDDRHLGLADRRTLQISAAAACGGFRPSGTFLFESVAMAYGSAALGVILTGMGNDGSAGLAALRRAGGRVVAQDEMTSVVFGMPATAIALGLAHAILPLDLIAARLLVWLGQSPSAEKERGLPC